MKCVRYSPSAALDLEAIFSTIAADNQSAALRVLAHIRSMTSLLAEYPGMGRPTGVPDALKLLVPGLPYKIIYEADELTDEIVILRIYHGARNLAY